MGTQAKDLLLEQVVADIIRRYGIEKGTVRFLGGFLNRAYECEKDGRPYIIRISFESQRTVAMVRGEVDWLQYLAACGLTVARPITSLRGNSVEVVEVDGKSIPVVVFEKAPGTHPGSEEWNRQLFQKMGSFVGRMHAATKSYVLGHEQACRPIWSEDLDSFGASYLHTVDEAIAEKFRWLRAYPEQFSRERDAYGLIHADFHRGNFYVHNGTLTLFDFDDSQYSWFAEDIAMALFYAISPRSWSPEERAIAQAFYDAFMEGYNRENSLDVHWLHEVPYFLKQREMNLFVILTALGEYEQGPWTRQFMEQRRQRILDDAPFVDIKFW